MFFSNIVMKFYLSWFVHCIFVSWVNSQAVPGHTILQNVSYGSDPQQIMDVYLPGGRDASVTKTIVLIHGGGWSSGSKEDMFSLAVLFYYAFPRYAIVNMNYRLGTPQNPGFPKQIEDVQLALKFITSKKSEYQILPIFGLVGQSAGAHLSMLYAYGVDKGLQVNVVCNIVGPSDLTDPAYTPNILFIAILGAFVGNYTYAENPAIYAAVSPVYYITRQSPKTISFYGGIDFLIPVSQGPRLEDKLDAAGVYNKYYLYPDENHGFINPNNTAHMYKKINWFFKNYL